MTAVSWSDGDLAQLASIAASIDRLAEHSIIAMKQCAARSAAEQAADLAKVFNNLKANITKLLGT
jgi:hypothetical protein